MNPALWVKITVLIAGFVVLALLLAFIPHAVLWLIGVYPTPVGTSPLYQFWSGVGLALVVTANRWLTSTWRKDRCHIDHCWHLGAYPVAGGQYYVCRKHHPHLEVREGQVTPEHVAKAHRDFWHGKGMIP